MPWGWLVNILNVLLRNIVFKVFSYHFRFCNGGSPRERVPPSLSPNTIYQGGTIKSFPSDSNFKESVCLAGDPGSNPGLGRFPGEGNDYPLQVSCLENPWTEDCGGLQSMGSQRGGHDWATNTIHYSKYSSLIKWKWYLKWIGKKFCMDTFSSSISRAKDYTESRSYRALP